MRKLSHQNSKKGIGVEKKILRRRRETEAQWFKESNKREKSDHLMNKEDEKKTIFAL